MIRGLLIVQIRVHFCLASIIPGGTTLLGIFISSELVRKFGYLLTLRDHGGHHLLRLIFGLLSSEPAIIIASVMNLVAIASTAAVAGLALHQSIQNAEFVQQWHEQSHRLWL